MEKRFRMMNLILRRNDAVEMGIVRIVSQPTRLGVPGRAGGLDVSDSDGC